MFERSGHRYAYPAAMEETVVQDPFVAATEEGARLLGTRSTVQWEMFGTWRTAEETFLPKYVKRGGPIRGVFPVNVPYMIPIVTWKPDQFFKRIEGRMAGRWCCSGPGSGGGSMGVVESWDLNRNSI